ncbi:D-alanyl-D-alanine carboxypeptidase/D-alanyl-D-alanine-endopeptidase [Ectopseudomonas mendocina]|uniref:D-alanyl-D-alanine carboxypeptidase/D-alanyl-D-alanine-endopeptidase n=1 Tax=Ectopseudomonas mendocina TaxID=300 RepID=A0ABZ2RMN8_ECTME
MMKTLRRLAFASLLLPVCLPLAAADTLLSNKVQQALKANKISSQSLSIAAIPLDGPGNSAFYNADVSVNPASTMKLVTTFAALELLGPNYQWKTEFYTDGTLRNGVLSGNLYLKGGGDPKLNMEKLWLLMRDLRANGVQQIHGDLILDRNYFAQPQHTEFNDDGGDAYKPFLVPPDSLMVNLKALRFITRTEGGKVYVAAEPPIASIQIDNQVKPLPAAKCPGWPDVRYSPVTDLNGTRVVVSGQLAEGCSSQTYIALLDHPSYAAGVIRSTWQELGGTISGQNRLGVVPDKARLLARAYSPDLAEVIRDINKYSNNTMAKQVFLSIGAHYRTSTDTDDSMAAQRAIRSWLARKGINASHLVMENGSGLSRAERVSARELAQLLQAAWKSPYAAEFMASLPLAGMDGTMRRRLQNSPLKGEARIKTGTLNNVRAIAGFSRDSNGKTWAVVSILNDPRPWGASSILDQVLLDLHRQPKINAAR